MRHSSKTPSQPLATGMGHTQLAAVADVVDDGMYILGRKFVEMTGFSACVDEVRDLMEKIKSLVEMTLVKWVKGCVQGGFLRG